jgi:hypothetical protein
VDRAEEIDDPSTDGDAQCQDRRRGGMFGDGGGRGGNANCEARVEQVANDQRDQLRRVDAATVTLPQQDRAQRRKHRNDPAREQDQRLRRDPKECRHPLLKFEFERAALAIAGDEPNRNERQQEYGRQFASAEGRSPDSDEWR